MAKSGHKVNRIFPPGDGANHTTFSRDSLGLDQVLVGWVLATARRGLGETCTLLQRHVWSPRISDTVSPPLVTASSAHFLAAVWNPVRQPFEQNRWGFPPCRGVNVASHQRQFIPNPSLAEGCGHRRSIDGPGFALLLRSRCRRHASRRSCFLAVLPWIFPRAYGSDR